MQKLEKDAKIDEIISKINEIVEKINDNGSIIEFDPETMNSEIKSYFDGTGGMIKWKNQN